MGLLGRLGKKAPSAPEPPLGCAANDTALERAQAKPRPSRPRGSKNRLCSLCGPNLRTLSLDMTRLTWSSQWATVWKEAI